MKKEDLITIKEIMDKEKCDTCPFYDILCTVSYDEDDMCGIITHLISNYTE